LLTRPYWTVVLLGTCFALARFSEAFLLLRAQQGGLALSWIPLVMVVMNVVYAGSAYPLGRLADRMSHTALLAMGLAVLALADLVLASSNHWAVVMLGVALWGLHLGMTQGLLAAMIAHTAPAELRGTAFGAFNLASGLALLIASVLAGLLWDEMGAAATFLAGAGFCCITLLCLFRVKKSGIMTQPGRS
jgi:MFS family permease